MVLASMTLRGVYESDCRKPEEKIILKYIPQNMILMII